MKWLFYVSLLFIVSGCAFKAPIKDTTYVFPRGTYDQEVNIDIKKTAEHFRFVGFIRLETDRLQLIALSPFLTTIFKLKDNLGDSHPEIVIVEPRLEKKKSFVEKYYRAFRPLLFLKNTDRQPRGLLVEKRNEDGRPIALRTSKGIPTQVEVTYSKDGSLPETIRITTEQFSVEIHSEPHV